MRISMQAQRHSPRRLVDDTTDLDPRPSAVRRESTWHDATSLRDATAFWGSR